MKVGLNPVPFYLRWLSLVLLVWGLGISLPTLAATASSDIQPLNSGLFPSAANTTALSNASNSVLPLPPLNTPIIDTSNTLAAADIQQLDQQILAIHKAGRAQIGIVLVPTTGNESIFDYALRVSKQWRLGDVQRDDGIVVVVAVQDHKIQILTGYGLEGILPDVILSRIIRDSITPLFRTGNYAEGLKVGLMQIDNILQMDPVLAQQQARDLQRQSTDTPNDSISNMLGVLLGLLVIGQLLRLFLGRFLSSVTIGGIGIGIALFSGIGIAAAMVIGLILFVLMLVGISPFLGSFGGGGGFGGGGFGTGGYSGGGGGFGGGGASGSW
jgi:uncharacterized protein